MVEEEPKVKVALQEEDDDDVQVDFMKLGKTKKKKAKKDGKKVKKAKPTAGEETSKFTPPI